MGRTTATTSMITGRIREVTEIFLGIAPGDQLLLLADTEQGIALPPKAQAGQIFAAITAAMPKRQDDKA